MKNLLLILSIILLGCQSASLQAQKQREIIKKSLNKNKVLVLDNLNGNIQLEASASGQIEMEVEKSVWAESAELAELGKKEVNIQLKEAGDTTYIYLQSPDFDYKNTKNGWKYDWADCDNRKNAKYEFIFDFKLKVPEAIHIDLRTVNRGDIEIKNMKGSIKANNINGAISMENIAGKTEARTINGDVKANYANNPADESSYYTLNGNINVDFKPDLSADFEFKSFNGDFYTDYAVEQLPGKISKNEKKKGDKTVYQISEYTAVRVNKGGTVHKFETFNGNIYIGKK